MMGRALLAIMIVATTLHQAAAQFGDMPGLPGSGPPGPGFGSTQRPPQCQALLDVRDELQKHGQAISNAKTDVKVACRLFRNYIATEAKMLKMLEEDGASCGASGQVIQQVRNSHAKARQIGKRVCDAASRPVVPSPTLGEALGTSPTLPDAKEKPFLYDGPWPPNRRP